MPWSTNDIGDHEERGGLRAPAQLSSAVLDPPSRFLPGPRPRRVAHRGLALDGAENTLRAFADALAAGADMLETDTHATADGTAVAIHDPTLARLTGDPRAVSEIRAREIDGIRVAGLEPLARLEDVLGHFPDVPVNIDVKQESAIIPAVTAITRTGAAGRVCLTSFDGDVAEQACRAVQMATGILPTRSTSSLRTGAFLTARVLEADALVAQILAPYGALQVPVSFGPVRVVSPRTVAAAHRAGCEVQVWTIDDPVRMRELLALGVDGIITNRVDLLSELTRHRQE
jgi:glycerophosphoryl diester phosphodiesterase